MDGYETLDTVLRVTNVCHEITISVAVISGNCVHVWRTYSNHGDWYFAAASPKLWNSLPANLRQADIKFQWFKRLQKTYLFGCWLLRDRAALWLTGKAAPHKFSYLLTYLLTCDLAGGSPTHRQPQQSLLWYTPRCSAFHAAHGR